MRAPKDVALLVVITFVLNASAVLAVPPDSGACAADSVIREAVARAMDPGLSDPTATNKNAGLDAWNVTLLSHVPLSEFSGDPVNANDVWGYVSESGREYAILGLNTGTGFVDVSDPENPLVIATIPDATSLWSDMAVYDQYAYNVNENSGGMQVFDLTQIDQGVVTELAPATEFQTAHNVYANPESGFVYPCGTNVPQAVGFIAYDLSDPANPVTNPAWTWNDSYAHDVLMVNYDDCPYAGRSGPCEIGFVFGGGAFLIVDVTDKFSMTTIANLGYPDLAYCHQGWITEDRRHVLIGDELDEFSGGSTRTIVMNVEDLANPFYVTSFTNGNPAIDHNLMVRGDYVYEANYASGLRVYDISDVTNAQEVGYFDTFPSDDRVDFVGAWGIYSLLPSGSILIGDMQGGLFVLDASDAVGCLSDANCDDGDPCTAGSCLVTGVCDFVQLPAGAACEDGDSCTVAGACDAGGICVSVGIETIACADDSVCTPGICNSDTGFCACVPCLPSGPAVAEFPIVAKNRYFSFAGGEPGRNQAIQVSFSSLPGYEYAQGRVMWIQEPVSVTESSGSAGASPPPTYYTAELGCTPQFTDWSQFGTIDVYDGAIVPDASFRLRVVGEGCDTAAFQNYSDPLDIAMSRAGDVVGDCAFDPCTPPQGVVDFVDISGVVDKFRNLPSAPRKARADLINSNVASAQPDRKVDFVDISYCVDAFRDQAAPLPGPPMTDLCAD